VVFCQRRFVVSNSRSRPVLDGLCHRLLWIQVFRSLLFPFLFLFLLTPIPGPVLDKVISFPTNRFHGRDFALFKLSGVPVLKTGFLLSMPTLQIEVAKECSGIRSSMMLLITGLLLAHLFLRSFWSSWFLCCVLSACGGQERSANLHPLDAWHARQYRFSGRQVAPQRRGVFSCLRCGLVGTALDSAKAEGTKTKREASTGSAARRVERS